MRRGLVDIVRRTAALRAAPRDLADHQRARPGPAPRRRSPTPGSTGSTSASTPSAPRRSTRSPAATGSPTWWPASRPPRPPGSARSRSTPSCCAASTTTRPPSCSRWCLERGYELRFIEQMPLDAQHGWSRDEMVTADEILAALRAAPRAGARRGAAGERAGRAVPRRRRPRHRRHHRLGHPAVLRCLRPGPAHRRRPGPQLPVRPRGVRPARGAARRCDRRGAGPALAWPRWPPSCPATASTTRRSSSRTGRCRPSAADRPWSPPTRYCVSSAPSTCSTTSLRKPRAPRKSDSEPRCSLAREPDLAALGGVQLGVVPAQRPDGGAAGSPWPSRCRLIG